MIQYLLQCYFYISFLFIKALFISFYFSLCDKLGIVVFYAPA